MVAISSEEHNAFFFRVEMEHIASVLRVDPKHGGGTFFRRVIVPHLTEVPGLRIMKQTSAPVWNSGPSRHPNFFVMLAEQVHRWSQACEYNTSWNLILSVFWDVASCSLVEVYRRFRGAFCLHHQGDDLKIGIEPTPETS
jgi:hypothetical protein